MSTVNSRNLIRESARGGGLATSNKNNSLIARGCLLVVRLFACAALLGASFTAQAEDCSEYPGGVLDGSTGTPAPSQLQVDRYCTIRNYPASDPLGTNFSFLTQPGQTDERWIIVFDNVVHTGQMACNSVAGHKIWFTNGSSTSIQEGCQNLLIPVEKIDKQNPAGQTTAIIGVPFTYTLTMPVLFDPATGTVINSSGSLNDLHGVTLWDDLNATGADLSYVSHTAYWQGSGAPVSHTFANVGGVLTFDSFPIVPAGEQIVVEITVVLEATAANTIGKQFINTAKWDFGRLIDGEFFEPLPGEWGITPPMTIVGPDLVVTKTGPVNLNLLVQGDFTIDVGNSGTSDAWHTTIVDRLPNDADGGMCDTPPQLQSARVFAADGVTPVPGKGPLVAGSDFSVNFSAAPTCELTLSMLTAAGTIGAGERLVINYQAELDLDTDNSATLTNVVGATEWFNDDSDNPNRQTYARELTDGTVGVLDHEDAHSLVAELTGFFFEKTADNLTTGISPATTATPGDRLRYTLRLRTTDTPLNNASIVDDLGALNALAVFEPGTLALVASSIPPGANSTNTDPNGGSNGAGLLDIRNLNVAVNSEMMIQFDVTLAPAITSGTYVVNQSQLTDLGAQTIDSDDPNVNGSADPDVTGDEDPTRILIESAPAFDIDKVSSYLDGDPTLLMAGETLRYTITVQNVGTDHASDAVIRDQIPANTTYVAGSTTLNGVTAPDVAGVSPLANGMTINSPANSTPGYLPADPNGAPGNVAVIEFDVQVYPDVLDGTVISNQAFVSAVGGGVVDQPSDDPRTPLIDDPTRDVVGNLPLIYAEKSAALQMDYASLGVVDPGDVLRYTIRISNTGAVDATGVALTDAVPANTTYVADTVTLNGEPMGQPDSGVFPLASGIPVSSSNLTPPIPLLGAGTLTAGEAAIVQFDLRVNDGVVTGTLITNQASVGSEELADVLTDGDGNPATGPEPTVVVVGPAQQLVIAKQVAVVGGGPAIAGATLEYLVRVRNVGVLPAVGVELVDDLDYPVPDQLIYVDQSATLNGEPDGIVINGSTLTVNYGDLQPGATIDLRFQALLNSNLAIGTPVTNTGVVYWNTVQRAEATVAIDVGGIVGVGILNGTVWHDTNYDDREDNNERPLEGWTVELFRNDDLVHTTATDVDGAYQILGVPPNYLSEDLLTLVFNAPGSGVNSALLGRAYSADFTNELQRITDIVIQPGSNLLNLDLPIDPNGVLYDAVTRAPVAGATLTLVNATTGAQLPATCFDDAAQQNQVTRNDGYYKFNLNFADPACGSGSAYDIAVGEPGSGYTPGYSVIIPPPGGVNPPLFNVPACPGSADDAVVATADHCEVQASEFAPGPAISAQSPQTGYHVRNLVFDASEQPASAQIFNNHIPIDPVLEGAVAITKTTPMVNVTRGQLIPYTITVANSYPIDLRDVGIVDRFPPGFRYIEGSARIDGVPTEPTVSNSELVWGDLTLTAEAQHTIQLVLATGAGVSEGEYVNRAQAMNLAASVALSGEATATVRLVPDPTFDCTDVIGKVYDDDNRNGLPDDDELGLQGVRLVTAQGLAATTDEHGRFHITCATTPREDRGSNFVLKLDDRSLPSGFRAAAGRTQIKRATRGKTLSFNFGVAIHRVVGLDIADGVFMRDSTEIRPQWLPRFDLLIEELQKSPSILRLSYLADLETPKLVRERVGAVKQEILGRWRVLDCCYRLELEHDIFWRLGEPAQQSVQRRAGAADD